ncbi:hypothetical protein, partial [Candidatus Hodarchaeum mangrovi]
MSLVPDSSQETPAGFWRWLLGHLTANPLIIGIVVFGTGLTIFFRAAIPILLGQALDVAIIDLNDLYTNQEQIEILQNF